MLWYTQHQRHKEHDVHDVHDVETGLMYDNMNACCTVG